MISRRHFLSSLAAGAGLVGFRFRSFGKVAEPVPPLKIGFFTDVHARPDKRVPEALKLAAGAMNEEQVDLWICGGDVIHEGHKSAAENCVESYEVFTDFLGKLDQPVHAVIGNHDFAGAFPRDGSPAASDPSAMWKSAFGEPDTYRSFELGGFRFIMLDSVELTGGPLLYRGHVDDTQLAWLAGEVATLPREQPIILTTHIPFRTTFFQAVNGPNAALPANLAVDNANEVLALFEDRNVPLVLQGHLHSDELVDWAGRKFLMGGAISGAWWRGPNRKTDFGYGIVELDGDDFRWSYQGYGWPS